MLLIRVEGLQSNASVKLLFAECDKFIHWIYKNEMSREHRLYNETVHRPAMGLAKDSIIYLYKHSTS